MSDRGLDFEKAEKDTACGSKLMVEMAVSGVRHHLNTQLSARIAEAREQERTETVLQIRDFCTANGFPFPVKFDKEVRAAESRLASLSADYQRVVNAVREWQEARENAQATFGDEDVTPEDKTRAASAMNHAEAALASYPVEGTR